MRLVYLAAAKREFVAAVDYFNKQRPGHGDQFRNEVIETMEQVRQVAELQSEFDDATICRKINRRFHYTIFYTVSASRVRVVAVAHHARQPDFWLDRLKRTDP